MVDMVKLSLFEKALLDAMIETSTVKNAQTLLARKGFPDKQVRNCYQALHNIKKKFRESQKYVGLIYSYRGRSDLLKKRLVLRAPIKDIELEQPEEEEIRGLY